MICTKCRRDLSVDAFLFRTERRRPLTQCRDCLNAHRRTTRRLDGGRTSARERDKKLVRQYGIGQVEYEALERAQDGRCALCGGVPRRRPGDRHSMAVDHDHRCCPGRLSCGRCIRGLLCHDCNRQLGHWEATAHRHDEFASFADRRVTVIPGSDERRPT